jgi:hypothetical protein
MKKILLIVMVSGSFNTSIEAHGGNTNSDNCHNDNRFKEYHCHNSNFQPPVKRSKLMICHKKGSTYHSRTKNFTPYDSISKCLEEGGRLPKK